MSKIFKLVRPKSLIDSNYTNYEYVIRWMGLDGSDYLYMFMDAEFLRRIRNDVINQEDEDNIESIINTVGRSVTLTANDLSLNDLQIILQMLENRYVTRILKDGAGIEKYAPDSNNYKYRLLDGRYEISFQLVLSDIKAWR